MILFRKNTSKVFRSRCRKLGLVMKWTSYFLPSIEYKWLQVNLNVGRRAIVGCTIFYQIHEFHSIVQAPSYESGKNSRSIALTQPLDLMDWFARGVSEFKRIICNMVSLGCMLLVIYSIVSQYSAVTGERRRASKDLVKADSAGSLCWNSFSDNIFDVIN